MVSGLVEALSWIKTLFASAVLSPKSFFQRDLRSEPTLCFGCFSPPALRPLAAAGGSQHPLLAAQPLPPAAAVGARKGSGMPKIPPVAEL